MRNKELLMALAGVVAAGILEAGLAEKAGWFILPAIFWNGLVRVYVFQMRKRLEKHDMEDATTVAGHSQISFNSKLVRLEGKQFQERLSGR